MSLSDPQSPEVPDMSTKPDDLGSKHADVIDLDAGPRPRSDMKLLVVEENGPAMLGVTGRLATINDVFVWLGEHGWPTSAQVEAAAKKLSYRLEYEGKDWHDFFEYDWSDQGEARERWRELARSVLVASVQSPEVPT